MRIKTLPVALLAAMCTFMADAAQLTVNMNTVSPTMKMVAKDSGEAIETGTPTKNVYTFNVNPGVYVLTAFATDGETVNGTIELNVGETDQQFQLHTVTAYANNKNWSIDNGDYTLDVQVTSKKGEKQTITLGNSITAGRKTFLVPYAYSYVATFTPSEAHAQENYLPLIKSGTVTANSNVSGAIPAGAEYSITVPENAEFTLGSKTAHLIDFKTVEPVKTEISAGNRKVTYFLADNQVYNYRTWMKGGLTQAGYFTMSTDESKRPAIAFTESDYKAFDPTTINHDVKSNDDHETGDILVNINPRGHLLLNQGETFKAHALRSWQLTDNTSNNYFIEPDFHYTVIDPQGRPSDNVISVSQKEGSSWADIKAIGSGTAIVLVTYDAIGLNYYKGATKNPYLGGEMWGAIWPENTGVYVVTVGSSAASGIKPNMTINEKYNDVNVKLAGGNVDAEHDVFYYLDTEDCAHYTFTPEGVSEITIAYPTIGEHAATYTGFGKDGVVRNEDGSYTVDLKEGRQIVRLADASGNAVYQVLTAKKCHREIVNASRPGSKIFQPGDNVTIQYSGLRHPANKIACLYNMNAFVNYKVIPEGATLSLGKNQYTFGANAGAQAVTVSIPADMDVTANPQFRMNDGLIQISGYGEPIGDHRNINPDLGCSTSFSAEERDSYLCRLPDVSFAVSPVKNFGIDIICDVENADIKLYFQDKVIERGENGLYEGTYGTYTVTAYASGYRYFESEFEIGDDAEGTQNFKVSLTAAENAWDGKTLTEPAIENGIYQIKSGAELAWFGNEVNGGKSAIKAEMLNDIDLGDYPFEPIGTSTSKCFGGTFNGGIHHIYGLNINKPTTNNVGLFGYMKGTDDSPASVSGIILHGTISGKQYVGGIAGYLNLASLDACANYCQITGSSSNVGGVAGYINNKNSRISNCYNAGEITGASTVGGIVGAFGSNADNIENVYNIGELKGGNRMGAIFGSSNTSPSAPHIINAFATEDYSITVGYTKVRAEDVESGYLAHELGGAFGQRLPSTDVHPVLGAPVVYKVTYTTSLDPAERILYTNGKLPAPEQAAGNNGEWQTIDGKKIESVTSDCTLFINYSTSGIDSVEADSETLDVYTIHGILILRNASEEQIKSLAPGIYLAKGKKFIVR